MGPPPAPGWLRALLHLAGAIAPERTAERLLDRMLTTRRARRQGPPVGERLTLPVRGEEAVAWVSGAGPAVVMLHGWDGSAVDFAAVARAVVAAGFRAVVLDAPGHGEATGTTSNLRVLADTLHAAQDRLGPAHAVVAHSFGAAAAGLALSEGLAAGPVVLLAPEPEPVAWVDAVGDLAGVREPLRRAMARRVGIAPAEVSLRATLRRTPLVIHDRDDRLVPAARTLATFPGALLTEGLGHRRLLSHPAVVGAVVSWIRYGHERSCSHRSVEGACPTCALAESLYTRAG